MIAIGSCIGSGIFITPYVVVQSVPHHGLIMLVWMLGGLIALTGALTFAELGAMYPESGGVYVYLREAYGELIGFLYGWIILLVINTGAIAALGMAFAEYISFGVPLDYWEKIMVAVAVIILLTAINIAGINTSQIMVGVFSSLKLIAIGAIILVGFLYYTPQEIKPEFSLLNDSTAGLWNGVLLALIGVLWSFGGWHHASYLAGEARSPQRTVPRAMIIGALVVTITYVLVNLAYMLLLPLNVIEETEQVASKAIGQVFSFGGQLVGGFIALSIFGTIAIYTMSAPRIYFAMAKDGVFFKSLASVHSRFRTPMYAMLLQAGWAICLLVFWGTFSDLITYVTFMDIAFMALAGISLFVFRLKQPERKRPYRTWGYPWVPAFFVMVSVVFVGNTLFNRPKQAIAGLVLVSLGVIAFYLFKRIKQL
jgi:APA family basic amino acid/polyamine antiporter